MEVSWYPSFKSTLALDCHLRQNCGLGEGKVVGYPETSTDPVFIRQTYVLMVSQIVSFPGI